MLLHAVEDSKACSAHSAEALALLESAEIFRQSPKPTGRTGEQ